jgi:hypothetical protein
MCLFGQPPARATRTSDILAGQNRGERLLPPAARSYGCAMQNSGTGLFLSIAMLAIFALVAGGMWLVMRGADRKRGLLMLAAAIVLLGNVLIWTWPIGT